MRSNKEMVDFHIENQDVINTSSFESKEDYVLYKIHTYAYEQAARLQGKFTLPLGRRGTVMNPRNFQII